MLSIYYIYIFDFSLFFYFGGILETKCGKVTVILDQDGSWTFLYKLNIKLIKAKNNLIYKGKKYSREKKMPLKFRMFLIIYTCNNYILKIHQ